MLYPSVLRVNFELRLAERMLPPKRSQAGKEQYLSMFGLVFLVVSVIAFAAAVIVFAAI